MDISKVERQTPAEGSRSEPPPYMRVLLQDILCFFILLSLALLIVAGILCVADDISRLQDMQRDPINGSQEVSSEGTTKQVRRYLRPRTWIRFFRCPKQLRQRDGKLEQLQEPEQDLDRDHGQGEGHPLKLEEQNKQQPTYAPISHPEHARLQAGGDHAVAEPASNQLDPESNY